MSLYSEFLPKLRAKTEEQSATASQTVFNLSTLSYEVGSGDLVVVINGKTQPRTSYTETSSTVVTLSEGLESGDLVQFKKPSYVL